MTRLLLSAAVAVAIAVSGCGRKKVETPQDLQEVFDTKASAAAAKSDTPEVQMMVNQAVTALQNKDEATAVMTLRDVRSNPALTEAQVLAVEDMMKKAYVNLSERAARGDQQAAAQIQMLNMNRR